MRFVRCKTCCMPTTRPDTSFVDGECSACRAYAARPKIDWEARKRELLHLLDRHDGRCIVPSSGGKDSTAQALMLKQLGADVTVVTARTCHLTQVGRWNIDNLAKHARTVEVVPNMTVRAKLNRIGMEMVGDVSWPEHIAIHRVPFRVACDLKIPLMFYGENPLNQYGSPPGMEDAKRMTQRWVSEFGGFLGLRTSDVVGMYGITDKDMQDYEAPSDATLERLGVEAHFLGQYLPWDSHANAKLAIEHGFVYRKPCEANWWDWENQDNLDTFWHDHMMYRKYGYGRFCAQISVDVRYGRVNREFAMDQVALHDGMMVGHYMGISVEATMERIGMKRDEFFSCMDGFTNWELFDGVMNESPVLKEFVECLP